MPNINLSQKSISLDLQHTGYTNTIYAQQGDVNSRRLTISLYDDGTKYNIPKNATVSLCGTRADNTVIYRDVNSFDQNVVTINFENAELAVKGIAKYKIEIKTIENGETKLLTSSLFKIKVYENIYDEDGKIASPQYSDLQRELDKIHEQENAIKEAEENREQAEEIRKNSETKRQEDTATAIFNAEKATKSANEATTKANNATLDVNTASSNANNIVNQLLEDKKNGLFKGDKGDKGDTGESGITTPINGFFTMSVDENGDLWCHYGDASTPPSFEFDSNGDLYFVIPD